MTQDTRYTFPYCLQLKNDISLFITKIIFIRAEFFFAKSDPNQVKENLLQSNKHLFGPIIIAND